jgi:hypothetical protein
MSQAEFRRRRGLALATFRYHRARAATPRAALEAPRLVELPAEPAPPPAGEIRLEFGLPLGPVALHGHPAMIAELLSLLATAPAQLPL